ncbi:MAG TPA: ComEA family DNA-binding protein [Bacillota bacterium]|jgi:competence protein ComEA|nr:ComEA family DNA-binding protein [Peptococcaceae bacterium MAG4]NLW37019.1 ComEA family DNA-binding protein [Peptococcaceae bacterium]HPZ43421.1 ComEA family DNA-binding protein [Bacillota bacterium]HQD75913.1 ComEA family DNA-binding protein [Bacillota bacterium]HUM58705.1 ComEA family DNA-binding protein [Bacillota bacterium]
MFQLERRQQFIVILLVGIIIFGAGYRLAQVKQRAAENNKPVLEKEEIKENDVIKVHVAGAVARPGVYQLPRGSRIIDAVQMALPADDALLDALKLAAPVNDGQTINVPGLRDLQGTAQAGIVAGGQGGTPAISSTRNMFALPAGSMSGSSGTALVNINTADLSQLDSLPGIGPALAQRIIDYRETNGPFGAVEDIKNVSGIGDKKFDALKDLITVY